ncbi:hypothetical protein RRG08_061194 [Elysia crispata]|uniref:Uncharacterized protein n=1 Tax=Elysia crispata TaxID=231223 RepID=A0AAE1DJI5_9GAST|nr:hypothetical protein RRG08_061194 [Elysia crispata]
MYQTLPSDNRTDVVLFDSIGNMKSRNFGQSRSRMWRTGDKTPGVMLCAWSRWADYSVWVCISKDISRCKVEVVNEDGQSVSKDISRYKVEVVNEDVPPSIGRRWFSTAQSHQVRGVGGFLPRSPTKYRTSVVFYPAVPQSIGRGWFPTPQSHQDVGGFLPRSSTKYRTWVVSGFHLHHPAVAVTKIKDVGGFLPRSSTKHGTSAVFYRAVPPSMERQRFSTPQLHQVKDVGGFLPLSSTKHGTSAVFYRAVPPSIGRGWFPTPQSHKV